VNNGADFGMRRVVLQSARCDDRGHFKIDLVPAQMPVRVVAGTPADARGAARSLRTDGFLVDSSLDVYFDPGEVRENVRLVAQSEKSEPRSAAQAKPEPLEQRLKKLTRNARLAGMRVLVALEGTSSKSLSELGERWQGQPDEIFRYLPLEVTAEEIQSEAALVTRLGWERPKAGEIELIAIDGTGAKLASQRVTIDRNAASERRVAEFIKRNAPAPRDAQALLAAAQREARDTGRRLWFVDGCDLSGGYFEIARWMDDQHALLAKDYVTLQVREADAHYEAVIGKFRPHRDDADAWFAIAEPDGRVLATSDGPLGNIGLPSSFEEKRHLKRMLDRTAKRLTPAERQRLIDSLTERTQ
jgi:hypothetical protein